MKAEYYDTVNFPSYAVCAFEYGNPLENKSDKILDMLDWEMVTRVKLIKSGFDLVSIEFGETEYFTNSPCFGLPCMCVEAVIYVKKL